MRSYITINMKIFNIKTNKLLILPLALLLAFAAVQAHAAPPSGQIDEKKLSYYPIYTISGTVTKETGAPAPKGRTIWFTDLSNTAEGKVDQAGAIFSFNVNDPNDATSLFAVKVPGSYFAYMPSSEGYGADLVPVALTGKGYDAVATSLYFRKGGGGTGTTPPPPVVSDEGPVILSIARATNGTDLVVSWKLNSDDHSLQGDEKVDIYVLYGDGSGVYAESGDEWKLLSEAQDNIGKITLQNQDGAGSPEAYFKGVISGQGNINNGLKKAVAVGKFNINLYAAKKYNFVSTPFYLYDNSDNLITDPEKIFSNKIAKQDMRVYAFDNSNSVKAYKMISYSGGWKGDVADTKLYPGFSYWIYNTFGDIPITVIGKHYDEKQRKGKGKKSTLEPGGAKGAYNVFALPNSQRKELKNLLTAKDGVRVYVFDNKNGEYNLFSYDPGTKDWTGNTTIKPTLGMWYYNKSDAQLDWIKE